MQRNAFCKPFEIVAIFAVISLLVACSAPAQEVVVVETIEVEVESTVEKEERADEEEAMEGEETKITLGLCEDNDNLFKPSLDDSDLYSIDDSELGSVYFRVIPYENIDQQYFEVTIYGKSPADIEEYVNNVKFCLEAEDEDIEEVVATSAITSSPTDTPTAAPKTLSEIIRKILESVFAADDGGVAVQIYYPPTCDQPTAIAKPIAIKYNFDYTEGVNLREGQTHAYFKSNVEIKSVRVALEVTVGIVEFLLGAGRPPNLNLVSQGSVEAKDVYEEEYEDPLPKTYCLEIKGVTRANYKLKGKWLIATSSIVE